MIKVVQIIKSFNRGGAEILLKEAFEDELFSCKQTESWLVVLHKGHISLLPDLNTKRIIVLNLFSFAFFSEYYKLYRFLKVNKFEIIHTHLALAGIIVMILKLISGLRAKVIYTEHSMISSYHKLVFFLNGILYRFYDYVVFISPEVELNVKASGYKFFYKYNGEVVYNGVNVDKFVPTVKDKNSKLTIGTIASMRKEKRLDRWVAIAAEIELQFPNKFNFIIGGDGTEMNTVKDSIDKYNLINKIKLPGIVYRTQDLYPQFDVFLMTSDFEGLGVALLEAMSCGCIPVATNVGGIKNIIFSSNGLKFEPDDHKSVLEFLGEMLNDKNKSFKSKQEVREIVVTNYSLRRQLDQLLSIYKNALIKEW
jgi:glycosyltransferase involved in cell wall biosynthesis